MAPKIFIIGATGYIGGDALHALYTAHPEYEYTALVRNTTSGAKVAASYPKIRLVYGTLDDSALISEESSKADIVLHTADVSAHLAAQAISKGLAINHTSTHPAFWIHVSGTANLTWQDSSTKTDGEALSQTPFNDLANVSSLTNLPDSAAYRDIEKLVLSSNSAAVKTAIACPPTIYGTSRGPGNTRSIQVPLLVKTALERGKTPMIGKGLAEWNNVYLYDVSALFVLLVENAAAWKETQTKLK